MGTVFLFLVGLLFLIKGGDLFVDGATGIARRFKLPEILIGATVVSIGTTLPEVMVSAQGAMAGNGAMAYGNALGSIICNTALIAAITVAVKPSKIDRKSMIVPVISFFVAAAFYVTVTYATGYFARWVGIVLLSMFAIYILINVLSMKKSGADGLDETPSLQPTEKLPLGKEILLEIKGERSSVIREIILLVIGAVMIAFGANWLVSSATEIAKFLGVPDTVISLTIVALGTSLPELVTAITSLIKGHGALSLGNIIGANLFNLVLVSGVAVTINPFPVPAQSLFLGQNASFVLDIPVMLSVMLILTLPALLRKKLSRVQGITLLCIYLGFVFIQFFFCVPAL